MRMRVARADVVPDTGVAAHVSLASVKARGETICDSKSSHLWFFKAQGYIIGVRRTGWKARAGRQKVSARQIA